MRLDNLSRARLVAQGERGVLVSKALDMQGECDHIR